MSDPRPVEFRFLPLDAERARRLGLPAGKGVPCPIGPAEPTGPFTLERMVECIEAYRRAQPDDTDYDAFLVRFLHHRGVTLANAGDIEGGRHWFRRAHELAAEDVGVLQDLARAELDLGRVDAAEAAYEELLRLGDDSLDTLDGLARTYACQGKLRRAVATAEEAERKNPRDPRALDLLTTLLYHTREVARLERKLFDQLEYDAANPLVLEKLGVYLRECGRLHEAGVCLDRARILAPANLRVRYQVALLRVRQGDLAGAERELAAVLADRPGDADALNALGLLRLANGQAAPARELFERAVAAAPQDYRGHVNLGRALLQGDPSDPAAALRHLARVLDLPAVDAEALSFVCVSAREHGSEELAERAEQALERLQAEAQAQADAGPSAE